MNALLPGIVDGALMRSASTEATREAEPKIALGSMTTNEQIANAILFLASPQSDGITREDVVIDGGMQVRRGRPRVSPIVSVVDARGRLTAPAARYV